MRNVTFVANGKEFKTLAEAKAESNYVDVVVGENYDAEYIHKPLAAVTFGSYTGKKAKGWENV